MSTEYIIIPGTQTKVYEGSVVVLNRLPGTKWVIRCGTYDYNGRRQKGWYFSSIPSATTMPVFKEDLVAMRVIDDSQECPPCPPYPPYPPYPPGPPAPVPIIFTPRDKEMIERSMITVASLEDRDKLGNRMLPNGKIVRVNEAEGKVEYYEWNSSNYTWEPATLGYRYMTRDEIEQGLAKGIVDIRYSDSDGALVVKKYDEEELNVPLQGIVHDISYAQEDLTLRIPIFGQPDLVVTIPKDWKMTACRYEASYERPDGTVGPSLVFTISNGVESEEIVTNAEQITNIYKGSETQSVKVTVDSSTSTIAADVKLSTLADNAIEMTSTGLHVDITGKADKKDITEKYLLVADGLGGFTSLDPGVQVRLTGQLSEIPVTDVPAAGLIAEAISGAVAAMQQTLTLRIEDLQRQINEIKANSVGTGSAGNVVVSTETGVERTEYVIGGNTLSPTAVDALATENAVKDVVSWKAMQ